MAEPRSGRAAELEAVITAFIRDELAGGEEVAIDPEESLFLSGLVDSVGIMRLVAHLESTYGMKVPPTELVPENFRSVRVMAGYVADRLEE